MCCILINGGGIDWWIDWPVFLRRQITCLIFQQFLLILIFSVVELVHSLSNNKDLSIELLHFYLFLKFQQTFLNQKLIRIRFQLRLKLNLLCRENYALQEKWIIIIIINWFFFFLFVKILNQSIQCICLDFWKKMSSS